MPLSDIQLRSATLVLALPEAYVVSASAGGAWLPMWFRNLQADPQAAVQVRRSKFATTAVLADAETSRELWAVTESLNRRFAGYRAKLPHEIPMVVLRPPK